MAPRPSDTTPSEHIDGNNSSLPQQADATSATSQQTGPWEIRRPLRTASGELYGRPWGSVPRNISVEKTRNTSPSQSQVNLEASGVGEAAEAPTSSSENRQPFTPQNDSIDGILDSMRTPAEVAEGPSQHPPAEIGEIESRSENELKVGKRRSSGINSKVAEDDQPTSLAIEISSPLSSPGSLHDDDHALVPRLRKQLKEIKMDSKDLTGRVVEAEKTVKGLIDAWAEIDPQRINLRTKVGPFQKVASPELVSLRKHNGDLEKRLCKAEEDAHRLKIERDQAIKLLDDMSTAFRLPMLKQTPM